MINFIAAAKALQRIHDQLACSDCEDATPLERAMGDYCSSTLDPTPADAELTEQWFLSHGFVQGESRDVWHGNGIELWKNQHTKEWSIVFHSDITNPTRGQVAAAMLMFSGGNDE